MHALVLTWPEVVLLMFATVMLVLLIVITIAAGILKRLIGFLLSPLTGRKPRRRKRRK